MRLAAALLAFAALEAVAQAPARWYLRIENDAFFDSDRWYSSGLRLARVQPRGDHEIEIGLVHEIYGPETKKYEFGVVDRAPSARLQLYGARHDRSPSLFQTLELALGVRGPAVAGRQVSDFIHRIISAHDVVWSRQESNRFDGYVAGARSHRGAWHALHYGALLGNEVVFAHAGAELRFGAPGSASALLRHAATPPGETRGWGGFVGVSVRGVARNEMLRRQYTAFAPELERRKAVVRAGGGLSWARSGMEFSLALVQESREFEGQREPHRFGSLTLHAAF